MTIWIDAQIRMIDGNGVARYASGELYISWELMMRPSLALRFRREAILHAVARHGLSNARVFGSAARGADTEDSDLDVLVDAGPRTSLLDLVKARHEIEDSLGVSVDLLTPDDLPASFRTVVLGEAVPV